MPRLHSQLAAVCLCALLAAPCLLRATPVPLLGGSARHTNKKDAREQISDLEQQWRAATLSGDVSALDKLLSDDYVGISWTGQVNTKASQLDRFRNKTLVVTRLDITDIKVKVVGPVAIVTSRSDVQGLNDGVELKGAFIYTRIYQRSPAGVWKITNFEAVRVPAGGRNSHRPGTTASADEHP